MARHANDTPRPAMVRVDATVPPEMRDWITARALEHDETLSAVIRACIRHTRRDFDAGTITDWENLIR